MKRIRLRSWGLTAALIAVAIVAWLYLAPSNIGGSTRYVVTSGISMEPRFHTGDLALVRPADRYTVGEIVAYRSTMLHTVVLHRIIAVHGDSYVFKGDNNDFIDPVRPTRSELLGKLWVHLPRAGNLLRWLHEPEVAAVFVAIVAILLFVGVAEKERRRRRRRRRTSGSRPPGIPVKTPRDHGVARSINFRALLTASAVAAAVFGVLGVIALMLPAHKASAVTTRYTQQVTFGYRASAPHGPVYPTGLVRTGDPIFLTLVHQLGVSIKYHLETAGASEIAGTEDVRLQLNGPGGWSRTLTLVPPTHFAGDHTSTEVTLDVPHLQSVVDQVEKLTGVSPGGQFTINIVPTVHIKGALAGRPIKSTFTPSMSFQMATNQLLPASASTSAAPASAGAPTASVDYTANQNGAASSPATVPNTLTVLGVSPQVQTVRWIALVGLLLSIGAAVFFHLAKRGEPFEESVRIQAQYGHMIVPIVGGEDLGWPPVDVPDIKALVRLAESGQRLILHNRSNDVDTYMVNDEGTVYRYQMRPSNVVWGEWSDTATPAQAAA